MTLPFPKEENTRKYNCFVCGVDFISMDEMKGHIVEKHDKERDYVLCPVSWCQFPVRDLPKHFKAKHPTLQMPKVPLEKATVWRDFKDKKKKKPKFRSGEFYSNKNQRDFHYRSGLECQLYEVLEEIPQVIKYDVEPFSIQYFFEGEDHKYYPDLSVLYDTQEIEIIEIKPTNQTSSEINRAKWEAAKIYCQNRGWNFTIMTEKGINKLKKRFGRS